MPRAEERGRGRAPTNREGKRRAALAVVALVVVGAPIVGPAARSAAAVSNVVGAAMTPSGRGYIACGSDGGVFTFGDAVFHGSMGGRHLDKPVVGCAEDPATRGYWLVAADGGVFSFGAPFFGSTGAVHLNAPMVGMAATPDGRGYWLVAADGGVFTFGDARFYGSTGDVRLFEPVVGLAATRTGRGYWLVAADGGVFTFGDAAFRGSASPARSRVVGATATPDGYALAQDTGVVEGFGAERGSLPVRAVAVISTPSGEVVLVANDGAAYVLATGSRFVGSAPVGPPPPEGPSPDGPPGGSWTLRFDDEFNGTSLDASKWSTGWLAPGVTPPVNTDERECYDPKQVSESDGALRLTVIASACTVGGRTYPYRSGMINSDGKAQFTYGFFQARIFLPGDGGRIDDWPAWWTDGQNWPQDGEMDVMEGLGGQACWHFHSDAGGPGSCSTGNFTGWHTYGADWEPGSVTYYYDGAEVGRITTGITSSPMYLILNDAVSGQGQAPTAAPSTMEVDYVRVWSKA